MSALRFATNLAFSHKNEISSMAHMLTRQLPYLSLGSPSSLHTAAVLEAARKGTRAKREAKKRASKKEVVKKEFVPLKKRLELKLVGGRSPRRLEDHLKIPTDDVYYTKYYRWKIYSVKEAIKMFREAHHETQLDNPNAFLNAYVELYTNLDKKNRYLDSFTDVVRLPHNFDSGQERKLLVVTEKPEVIEYARQMGVDLAVGREIIKIAQKNEIDMEEFKYVISELSLLPELVAIRGLMRRTFPNTRNGTAGNDLIPIIDRFSHGVEYKSVKHKYHQDFGTVEVPFGRLNMTDDQLEENLTALVKDIEAQKLKKRKSSGLVSLVVIRSPPSLEKFKVNHHSLLEEPAVEEAEATVEAEAVA